MKKNEKEAFLIYLDYKDQFELLSDEELGKLLRGIMVYEETGEVPNFSGVLKMAFSFIKKQLDKDAKKWEEEKQKRSEAGKNAMAKRWGSKQDSNVITEDNKNSNVKSVITKDNKNNNVKSVITKITDNVNVDVNVIKEKDKEKEKIFLFQEIYNNTCTNLPKISKITDKRKKSINNFLKEFTIEQFKEICQKANNSDFLTGKNDRNWKASFDFLMRVDKATTILEGGYQRLSKNEIDYHEGIGKL